MTAALTLVFLGALLIRLVYLWELRDADVFYVLVADGYVYHRWARDIARGSWLGDTVFYQAPLYPYFLASLYALFEPSLLVVRFVQAVLGALGCLCLALAGRAFFSPPVGLLAGALLAIYAPAVFFDGLVQKAVLDLCLMAAFLWFLGRLGFTPHWFEPTLAGFALGVLALTRENALVLVPVGIAWLLLRGVPASGARRLGHALAFVAGLAAALAPVTARNWVVGGELFVTTSQFGPNFYIGNNARANGLYTPLSWGHGSALQEREDAIRLAEAAVGRPLTPGEVSRYWTGRALGWIVAHPGRWLRLVGRKLALAWNRAEIIDSEDPAVYADGSWLLRVLQQVAHFGTVAPLAAVGLWATWPARRRLWVLYLVLAAVSGSVALFFVFARYRYPLVPVLALFAAAGAFHLVRAGRAGAWRDVGVGLAIALAAAALTNWPLGVPGSDRAVMYHNMGVTLSLEGQVDRAIVYYERALAANPGYVDPRLNLADTLASRGRREEAIQQYQAVLRLRPGLALAEAGLRRLGVEPKPGR